MRSWNASVARGFRARANALIPVLDVLERDSKISQDLFSGDAAVAYEKRRRQIVSAVGRLIDAYNRCARALENATETEARYVVGSALAEIKDIEADLARITAYSMPALKGSLAPSPVVKSAAPELSFKDVLVGKIPSRPAANGVPQGMSSTQFRKLVSNSIKESASDAAAAALLWASSNLGVPYSQENRQKRGFFDCSSFVSSAFESAGVPMRQDVMLYDTTDLLRGFQRDDASMVSVSMQDAKPGDLILYERPPVAGAQPVMHVVILLANGYIMHAPNTGSVTRIEKLNPAAVPVAVKRIKKND